MEKKIKKEKKEIEEKHRRHDRMKWKRKQANKRGNGQRGGGKMDLERKIMEEKTN